MGRSVKRRKNSKARSEAKSVQSYKSKSSKSLVSSKKSSSMVNQNVPEITIELDIDSSKYDSANPLVLPGSKASQKGDGDTKKSDGHEKKKPKKVVSLKKQKKLRKILDRKKKVQDRSKILEELKKYQLDGKMYSALVSTSAMHSKGLKRGIDDLGDMLPTESEPIRLKTSAKKRRMFINTLVDGKGSESDNVLGFEKSDSEQEKEEEDEKGDEKNVKEMEEENKTNGQKGEDEVKVEENTSNDQEDGKESDKAEMNISIDPVEKATEKKSEQSENGTVDGPVEQKSVNKENETTDKMVSDEQKSKNSATLTSKVDMTTRFVPVNRDPLIEESRAKLPILGEEQIIMETIRYNDVTILCGETGSGKTTQIPQFLYEAGFAINRRIGITEPRRVAAIAMSHRVAQEMNLSNETVSYQIRFEGNCSEQTKIKFMTDGILLKEIQKDLLLSNYSVIIIDEAHERTVYSDILIGLLSRIVKLRAKKQDPLKLIIMSATLRVDDFTTNPNLFKTKPPVIKIESRQYPVSVHFNKITPDDYITEAFTKVCKIHRNMPKAGGILVFLTGQQEVVTLCQKLRRTFPFNEHSVAQQKEKEEKKEEKRLSRKEAKKHRKAKPKTLDDIMPQIDLDAYGQDVDLADDASDDENNLSSEDDEDVDNIVSCSDPLYVLPLFSHLNEKRQQRIFETPPEGVRLCVVATNIAETSLTIPNIKYVVDTGKVKMKYYDQITGVSTFLIDWTSKASADQRAGRAGRMGPGHCYRLFSSAIFKDDFKDFSDPEIVRKPIDDLVLQMKSMNIDNVTNFPFPTPPKAENVIAAEKRLVLLGALKEIKIPIQSSKSTEVQQINKSKSRFKPQFKIINRITSLGKVMSHFPLSPRFAKMLILASQHNLISYGVSIVSALTVQEIFVSQMSSGDEEEGKKIYKDKLCIIRKRWAGTGNSLLLGDMMVLLCGIGAWEHVGCTSGFCSKYGLRLKAMSEIRKLRQQLQNEIGTIFPQLDLPSDLQMVPPTDGQAKCLRQVLLSGLFDHVARKMAEDDKTDDDRKILKNAYKSVELDSPVYISTDSVLHDLTPEWVVYQEIYETSKLYMRNVLAIEPQWIPIYAPTMCTFSKPLVEPSPRYDTNADCVKCTVTCTFGPHQWPLPDTEIEYPESVDKYRWFVRFLLEGDVIDYFSSKRSLLLSNPSIMQKSWSKLQKRTEVILTSLVNSKVVNKKGLYTKWKENPKYLLKEFLQWIPEAYHLEIQSAWPPLPKSDSNDKDSNLD